MQKFSKTFVISILLFIPLIAQGASSDIDINTAPLEKLEEIIGIGPALAQRIIEERPFDSLNDLIKVKGIGEKTLQKIKDQGLAWASSQEKPEPKQPLPKAKNNEPAEIVSPSAEKEKTETGSLIAEAMSYPLGIVFNEILPSPEGADAENEWTVPTNEQKHSVFL